MTPYHFNLRMGIIANGRLTLMLYRRVAILMLAP